MHSNKPNRYGSELLSASVLVAALFSTAPALAADPVVWVSWGGSYGLAEKKSYLEPWMKANCIALSERKVDEVRF